MSDIAKSNNIFYEARAFNSSQVNTNAQQDELLIYPLLKQANLYNVSVSKAEIPLNTIPLRKSNIPLQTYKVGLLQGEYSATANVRQLNANSSNYLYGLNNGNISSGTFKTNGNYSNTGNFNISSIVAYPQQFIIDAYGNYFVTGSQTENYPSNLYIISNGNIVITQNYTNIKSIYMNSGLFYVLDEGNINASVYIFENATSESGVQLNSLTTVTTDFGGNLLKNSVFVIGNNSCMIVGHDANIITIYNSNFVPLTDYQISALDTLQAGNLLDSKGVMCFSSSNESNDSLFAVDNNEIYNPNGYVQLSQGSIASSPVYIDANYIFGIGTDGFLYSQPYPIVLSNSWYLTNNSHLLVCLGANKNGLYCVDGVNGFRGLNLSQSTSLTQQWYIISDTLQANGNNITAMDFNPSTNKLLAVASNDLYYSNFPVQPYNYMFIDASGNMTIKQGHTNSLPITATQIPVSNLQTGYSNNDSICSYSKNNDAYYFIEGASGSQVIEKRDQTNYSFSSVASYNPAESAGIISKFSACGGYFAVYCDANKAMYIYDIDTTNLVNTINISPTETITAITALDDNFDILAYAVFDATLAGNCVVNIYNCATNAQLSQHVINDEIGSTFNNCNSLVANSGDVSAGCNSLFFTFNNTYLGNNNSYLYKLSFSTNYTVITASTPIDQLEFGSGNFESLSCNANFGLVYVVLNNGGACNVNVYVQASNYNTNNVKTLSFTWSAGYNQFLALPNLNKCIQFTQITSNIPINYISLSRSNTSKLYTICTTDNNIYNGYIDYATNTTTQSKILLYQANQYYGLLSKINNNTGITSTIQTLNINNQSEVATIQIPNTIINCIARDEQNQTFLLLNNNKVNIYSFDLNLQSNINLTSSWIYARDGEDIDAGPVDITNYGVLIDRINLALLEAWDKLRIGNPSASAEPPSIVLDYSNGKCTLNYDALYSQVGNGILFNSALWNLIKFNPYTIYSSQNTLNGLYLLGLVENSTSKTQSVGTITSFNLLKSILIQSTTIYVTGSYVSNNIQNQIITTIDVPLGGEISENQETLYYQPSFLRPFQIQSYGEVNRLQLNLLYQYRDFTTYQLTLAPQSGFSVNLLFNNKSS